MPSAGPRYAFQPRWREELVCTAPEGSFCLELTMGTLHAYLPTEADWKARAPAWAREDWPVLHAELSAWCMEQRIPLTVEAGSAIW